MYRVSFFIFFSFLFWSQEAEGLKTRYQLGICTIFRDEARFLREWIEYHRLVGVEKFILYDNLSQDNCKEVLEPYIECGIVKLVDWPYESANVHEWNSIQCGAYENAIKVYGHEFRWLAVIDSDEFLLPLVCDDMRQLLSYFTGYAGLALNWQIFGTSSIEKVREDQLLIEQLKRCSSHYEPVNTHVKSIVQPRCVKGFENPHYANYKQDLYAVSTSGKVVKGPFNDPICCDAAVINHYWTRDVTFAREHKLPRRHKWHHGVQLEELITIHNEEEDHRIAKFISALKARLHIDQEQKQKNFSNSKNRGLARRKQIKGG